MSDSDFPAYTASRTDEVSRGLRTLAKSEFPNKKQKMESDDECAVAKVELFSGGGYSRVVVGRGGRGVLIIRKNIERD